MRPAALLAVDGGGSKMDAALLRRDGTVIGAARVRAEGYEIPGDEGFIAQIDAAVREARADAGFPDDGPAADVGVYCLAGADLRSDDRRIAAAIAGRWSGRDVVRNDTFAVLRAGTDRDWGVGLVCGSGTNCSGVSPAGKVFRFHAVGAISGDWGGGYDLGETAIWHAVRSSDGRGPRTSLEHLVPERLGKRTLAQVTRSWASGEMVNEDVRGLAPVLFRAAADGDVVARAVVERQADEIVLMVRTAIRRLGMSRLDPDVVLGGGVVRADDAAFHHRIEQGIAAVCPRARVRVLDVPPLTGAAMLGLDVIDASRAAHRRARGALTHERLTADTSGRRKER